MWLVFALLLVAVLVTLVLVTMILARGRTQALVRVDRVQTPDAVDEDATLRRLVRDLAPLFTRSIARLRKTVRGVDVRYGVPWYLLVGPVDEGKGELLADAVQTATPRPEAFAGAADAAGSVAWHYFSGGVVIDVGARLVFPSVARDLTGWRALLELLKRHRPRRPLDGILVAIPAPLLLDEQWKRRAEDLGIAIRERLAIAQGELGFTLPVYVILTQSDRMRGFSAFAEALPDPLRQDMVGWSNPHAPELVFQGTWVEEGLEALHRGIVHLQMELFAATSELDRPSEFFLFSAELPRLATPLRTLLDEIFRPTAYAAACSFRGFYLCGQAALRPEVTLGDGAGVIRGRSAAFLADLLERKIFPERGLASPLAGTLAVRTRTSRLARAAAAILILVLGVGSYLAYGRLLSAEEHHVEFLRSAIDALRRRQSVDVETGLNDGYDLLIRLESLSRHPFRSVFYPTSWMAPMDDAIGDVLRATFGDVLLPHFKAGLEAKGRRLFERSPADEATDEPVDPVLENDPNYQALRQFSRDYMAFVENYMAYDDARHEEGGSVAQVAQLANYVTGRSQVSLNLPDHPYGHAVHEASFDPIDCSFADPFARVKAQRLLARFEQSWFGENNPVRLSADGFAVAWEALTDRDGGSLTDVDDQLNALAQAVTSWGIVVGHARDLRVPVLDQPPFSRVQQGGLCPALVPDLSADVRRVAAGRDALADALRTMETAPFGALLEDRDQVLTLIPELEELTASFDVLHKQPFWIPVQERQGALPARITWRPQALEDLQALFEAYESYRTTAFGDVDPAYRRSLLEALDQEIGRRLELRLTFEAGEAPPLPAGGPALLAEIGRLDAVLVKIAPIVEHLHGANEPFARRLTALLSAQATEALRRLDREALARHPYLADPRTDALSVALSDALRDAAAGEGPKRWAGVVDEHRESLRRFALAAEPIVRFFESTGVSSPLAQRWSGIVVDVEQYDQKIGNSGLATLETFLRDTYPTIVPERDCAPPRMPAVSRAGGGTLAPIRNQLLDEAVRRCRAEARASVEERYEAVAGEFTRRLAGRFPFSAAADGVREATIAEAVAFFRAYERHGGPTLGQQLATLSCGDEAVRFMRQVDALAPLLATSRELGTAVAVDIVPEFRVNRDSEIGGNQVVAWDLSVGRQTFRDTEPVKTGRWTSGDRIRLELRFASDSPDRPLALARTDGVSSVEGRTARFEFGGSWALLALLGNRAPSSELRGLRDDAPHTLRFEIPVERDAGRPPLTTPATTVADRFRVFMRLRLVDPAKKDVLVIEEMPTLPPGRVSCASQEGRQR